jgi:hypothetical protein
MHGGSLSTADANPSIACVLGDATTLLLSARMFPSVSEPRGLGAAGVTMPFTVLRPGMSSLEQQRWRAI